MISTNLSNLRSYRDDPMLDSIDSDTVNAGKSIGRHHRSLTHANAGGDSGNDAPSSTTTVNKAEPWEGVQEYMKLGYADLANKWGATTPSFYPGSTVTPFSDQTTQALNMMENRAMTGSPTMGYAANEMNRTLQGDYLNANPYFEKYFSDSADQIQNRINSQFGLGGRSGSGIHAQLTARELADARNNMYMENYTPERENMMRAQAFAPQIAANDYTDIASMARVGQAYEGLDQQRLNEAMARHDFAQNAPMMHTANYLNILAGAPGGTSTGTTTGGYMGGGSNTFGNMLSGGMAGYGLSTIPALGMTGYGLPLAIGGAMLGGLFS